MNHSDGPSRTRRRPAAKRSLPAQQPGELPAAFGRLNHCLSAALAAFDAEQGGPVADRLRGLVITPEQCAQALSRAPGVLPASFHATTLAPLWPVEAGSTAQLLASQFKLEAFDLDALLIALACELDLRYEPLFGYLQDDVTRKRPTVDLVLRLLCHDDASRRYGRSRFDADAPLRQHGLIELHADTHAPHPPLLAQFVCPDAQLLRLLLGASGLDARLASCCVYEPAPQVSLADLFVSSDTSQLLGALAQALRHAWVHGPEGNGAVDAARAMAHVAGLALLRLDASRVEAAQLERQLQLAQREAWYRRALLCIDHAEHCAQDPQLMARIAAGLSQAGGPVVFVATRHMPAELLGLARPVALPVPDAAQRERCWRAALSRHGLSAEPRAVQGLAACFRLTPVQISSAVDDAVLRAGTSPTLAHWQAAARAQSGDALASVADKVDARATWDDIVLPPDTLAQLRELIERVEQHERVFNAWGFAHKLSRGRGTAALFSGASGTGKTMAAEVIANALGLDLYRIDLARVVNKYIGETEKNLDRVFNAAESANAILFFDEADALFGKRSEVKDAHDRYANIEVSYLLQKMEQFDGIAILASNLADNLDAAFTRRLAAVVHFPMPDEAARLGLWQRAWPRAVQLAETVDRAVLARELKLAGGSIKNIALGAAFSAAANGGVVDEAHIARAVQREYQKAGRLSAVPQRFLSAP